MAAEIVIVPGGLRLGKFKAKEAQVRGMAVSIEENAGVPECTKATSATPSGEVYIVFKYDTTTDVGDTTTDTIALGDRVVTFAPGSMVATDQYDESNTTGYNVGDDVEIGTDGKFALPGGTPGTAVAKCFGTRPKNSSATKEMIVVKTNK